MRIWAHDQTNTISIGKKLWATYLELTLSGNNGTSSSFFTRQNPHVKGKDWLSKIGTVPSERRWVPLCGIRCDGFLRSQRLIHRIALFFTGLLVSTDMISATPLIMHVIPEHGSDFLTGSCHIDLQDYGKIPFPLPSGHSLHTFKIAGSILKTRISCPGNGIFSFW